MQYIQPFCNTKQQFYQKKTKMLYCEISEKVNWFRIIENLYAYWASKFKGNRAVW